MLTSTVTNFCKIVVVLPAGTPSYVGSRIGVEITGLVGTTETTILKKTDISVVNATSSATGSITVNNIPLFDGSGNSVKVKYYNNSDFNLATQVDIVAVNGTYVRAYNEDI
jgi:hypothetical protein